MYDILKFFQASDSSSHFILRQLHLNIHKSYFKIMVLASLHRLIFIKQIRNLGEPNFWEKDIFC